MSKISVEDFEAIRREQLPFTVNFPARAERIDTGEAIFRLPYSDGLLRPGGTINGPAMMALSDMTMYAVVMSEIGMATMAVTSNLNMNFLRRPGPRDLIAKGRILKLGRRLAYGDVTMYSDGEAEPVAHATVTYSIPPDHESGDDNGIIIPCS